MNANTWGPLALATRRIAPLLTLLFLLAPAASAGTLVGDVFVNGFEGWADTFTGVPAAGDPPSWGTVLTDSLSGGNHLIEDSDGRAGDGTGNDGNYTPFLLINTADVTPSSYNLSASLATFDNDGHGLVFGYQDNDNYFRIGFRNQAGNLGFPTGVSVQKVVAGVATQIGWDATTFVPPTDGTPYNVDLFVNGPNGKDWSVAVNNVQILSGTDDDLQPGNYGAQSWGQGGNAWVVRELSISSFTLNKAHNFADALSPWSWRALTMTNADSVPFGTPGGTFHQAFTAGTIEDGSNGFVYATETAPPNTDFIGPAVVIDEAGSESWTNYQMRVRMTSYDDDSMGLLVRVADDDTFYRINFSQTGLDSTPYRRPPAGMSIQKNDGGVWTELFSEAVPEFLYSDATPFDVQVNVVGNSIEVRVINDPDGVAEVINYATVIDGSDPILAGTVGFTTWGNDGSIYGRFGGDGDVLLSVIPEPASFVLFALLCLCLPVLRRRR